MPRCSADGGLVVGGAVVVAIDDAALRSHEHAQIAHLGAGDAARLRGIHGVGDRLRFLAGRQALRRAAAVLTGRPEGELVVEAGCPDCGGPHGRPRLEELDGVRLSLTHAGGRAIAAAAPFPVGIDAEPESADAGRLAAIAALTGEDADPLRRWTRIEAVLKADGRGLRLDPASVRFGRRGRAVADGRRYRLHEVEIDDSLCVSLAVATR